MADSRCCSNRSQTAKTGVRHQWIARTRALSARIQRLPADMLIGILFEPRLLSWCATSRYSSQKEPDTCQCQQFVPVFREQNQARTCGLPQPPMRPPAVHGFRRVWRFSRALRGLRTAAGRWRFIADFQLASQLRCSLPNSRRAEAQRLPAWGECVAPVPRLRTCSRQINAMIQRERSFFLFWRIRRHGLTRTGLTTFRAGWRKTVHLSQGNSRARSSSSTFAMTRNRRRRPDGDLIGIQGSRNGELAGCNLPVAWPLRSADDPQGPIAALCVGEAATSSHWQVML